MVFFVQNIQSLLLFVTARPDKAAMKNQKLKVAWIKINVR